MNTSVVIYSGDLRTENIHSVSGSSIITDAPRDNFGKGEYFSPTDLLATSLANCILTTMAIATRNLELDLKGSKATVIKTMGIEPRRVVKIDVDIELPESVIPFKDQLEHAAHNCPAAKSLHPDIQQNVRFNYVLLK